MIGTVLAYATGWLATKWLSWLGTVVGWVWWAISTAIKGIFSFLQDPKETFAVAIIAFGVCGATYAATWAFAGDKYRQCQAEKVSMWKDASNKDREDARKAAEAIRDRQAAEAAERQRQINEANTKKLRPLAPLVSPDNADRAARPPAVAGVRDKPAKVRRGECEQGLFGCL